VVSSKLALIPTAFPFLPALARVGRHHAWPSRVRYQNFGTTKTNPTIAISRLGAKTSIHP